MLYTGFLQELGSRLSGWGASVLAVSVPTVPTVLTVSVPTVPARSELEFPDWTGSAAQIPASPVI